MQFAVFNNLWWKNLLYWTKSHHKNKIMSQNITDVENIILPPEKRIQQLSLLSSKIELNTNIAARK